MSENTGIEWCDSTFNPWVGCTKVSPACDHCYAEGWAKRSGLVKWGDEPRRRTSVSNWREPLKWQATAAEFEQAHGHRRRVFCASLADVFDNQVPDEWRQDLWSLIEQCWGMDWLLLTKRPQNIGKMLPDAATWENIRRHVWLGTTVEDQQRANQNIPHLLEHDAAARFVSIEPMLGPITFRGIIIKPQGVPGYAYDPLIGAVEPWADGQSWDECAAPSNPHIDWVIAGGESGPHARPSHPDWFRSLRDQCAAAGVPFLFKQWGEYLPESQFDRNGFQWAPGQDGQVHWWVPEPAEGHPLADGACSIRVGKKAAGRFLDGVEHNGFPSTDLARAAA